MNLAEQLARALCRVRCFRAEQAEAARNRLISRRAALAGQEAALADPETLERQLVQLGERQVALEAACAGLEEQCARRAEVLRRRLDEVMGIGQDTVERLEREVEERSRRREVELALTAFAPVLRELNYPSLPEMTSAQVWNGLGRLEARARAIRERLVRCAGSANAEVLVHAGAHLEAQRFEVEIPRLRAEYDALAVRIEQAHGARALAGDLREAPAGKCRRLLQELVRSRLGAARREREGGLVGEEGGGVNP